MTGAELENRSKITNHKSKMETADSLIDEDELP